MTQHRDRRVRAVEHAMQLIALMRDRPEGLRAAELVAGTGLGKSTVHELLATLEGMGHVAREGARYRPGMRLAQLSAMPSEHAARLRTAFGPALRAFSGLCGEDCFLSVAAGGDSYLVIDGIDREGRSFLPAPDATRDALATSAAGKVLLAHDRRLRALHHRSRRPLPMPTGELQKIRERGYALDVQASRPGLNCVALPLRLRGEVVATLSASGRAEHLGAAQMQRTATRAMRGLFDLLKH